eukprot:COSAG02_NODE_759_length_17490_cov_29.152608_12_plen_55_part_00
MELYGSMWSCVVFSSRRFGCLVGDTVLSTVGDLVCVSLCVYAVSLEIREINEDF